MGHQFNYKKSQRAPLGRQHAPCWSTTLDPAGQGAQEEGDTKGGPGGDRGMGQEAWWGRGCAGNDGSAGHEDEMNQR